MASFRTVLMVVALGLGGVLAGCQGGKLAPTDARPAVLLVLTNHGDMGDTGEPTGFFLAEAAHPWHVFNEAGWIVVLASPEGGDAPIDPRSVTDPDEEGQDFLDRFARDGVVPGTARLTSMKASAFEAIFFAGGHGTMWDFPEGPGVQETAEGVYRSGGVVAAVCHGPAALVNLRARGGDPLVAGRRVTGFTNDEEAAVELVDAMPFLLETRLRELGAEFVGAGNFEENVVVDGRLVTGQNPASARGAAEAVVRVAAENEDG
ncbi:MAG: type 1 glutamine amidotransferase domain-containing protein [Phycisphaerales bacterium]|jgi:putative intracellular protease/amidase